MLEIHDVKVNYNNYCTTLIVHCRNIKIIKSNSIVGIYLSTFYTLVFFLCINTVKIPHCVVK